MVPGMDRPRDIRSLIDAFGPRRVLADMIGEPVASVHKWAQRGTIPVRQQIRVLEAALAARIEVSAEEMIAWQAAAAQVETGTAAE